MYNEFFGFRERPFRLVPDPAYLFLSKSHEEAMAHLIYAISQGEGFAEIIGEAGTGKTTLCRAFLEKLNDTAEVAYIFNPKLDSIELLKAINDEFGIDSKADNIKELIDTLNVFLMEKRTEGKNVILLIDEAQNLTKEVLEQLRLLSNLETTTIKLLQIILVGQPELAELLDAWELRQLKQRITLSCFLKPFTYRETAAYIRHRISIAAQRPGVTFSRAAIRAIYKFSSGVPRLVNIASDRALLLAYGLNRKDISGREARAAVKELTRRGGAPRSALPRERGLVFMTALLLAAVFIFIFYHFKLTDLSALSTPKEDKKSLPQQMEAPAPPAQEKTASVPDISKPDSVPIPPEDLAGFLRRIDGRSSRKAAFKVALDLWGIEMNIRQHLEELENDEEFFRIAAIQHGFSSLAIQNDLELVKKLDKPAIIECYLPGNANPRYAVISAIDGDKLMLEAGEKKATKETVISELESYWAGAAYILWKNYLGLAETSPYRLSEDAVIKLKIALQDIGFRDIQINASYDNEARDAIKLIQERHALKTDGIVGPLTQIALYNEIKSSEIPHINKR